MQPDALADELLAAELAPAQSDLESILAELAKIRGREAGETLHAPWLLRYEVANALTRKVVADELDLADAEMAWHQIAAMPIVLHDFNDGPEAIQIALRLRRESVYDASYVAWLRSSARSCASNTEMRLIAHRSATGSTAPASRAEP